VAIARAVDSVKSAQDAKRAECAGLLANHTATQNTMSGAMSAAGFGDYNLTPDGQLVAKSAEHVKRQSSGNTSGKRGATTVVNADGNVREFESLVKACEALGVEISQHGIGFDAGASKIVKALKASGAKVVTVERK
jgi:hypothetical protein